MPCYSFVWTDCSGSEVVPLTTDSGAEFFGLAHPTVQYLIQSCAGARKCVNYRCARFELSHVEADAYCEDDASVNALLFDRLPTTVTSIKTLTTESSQTLASTAASCRPILQSAVPPP